MKTLTMAEILVCNEDGHPFKDLYIFESEKDEQEFVRNFEDREDCYFYDCDIWAQRDTLVVPNVQEFLAENCRIGFNDQYVLSNNF